MAQAGPYRRIQSRLWLDPPFAGLPASDQRIALYCLTGPQTNAIGLYKLSPGTAAEELHLTKSLWSKRFLVVRRAFEWPYDEQVRVLWIPQWLAENLPANPNVVRFWRRQFDEIPECVVKTEALAAICAFLATKPEPFREPFRELFPESFRNPLVLDLDVSETVPPSFPPDRRAERQRANARHTRQAVDRLRVVLAEHGEARERIES